LGATWAKAPVPISSATHSAPAIIVKRCINPSHVIVFSNFPRTTLGRHG
jgi:hypothetical protein